MFVSASLDGHLDLRCATSAEVVASSIIGLNNVESFNLTYDPGESIDQLFQVSGLTVVDQLFQASPGLK